VKDVPVHVVIAETRKRGLACASENLLAVHRELSKDA
jgi:hypothetical protein